MYSQTCCDNAVRSNTVHISNTRHSRIMGLNFVKFPLIKNYVTEIHFENNLRIKIFSVLVAPAAYK